MIVGNGCMLVDLCRAEITDVKFFMKIRKLIELYTLFDIVEIRHQCFTYHGNYTVLEVINHCSVFDISHIIVHHLNSINEGLQKVKLEKVRLKVGQILSQI
jgi:hypothetical protein